MASPVLIDSSLDIFNNKPILQTFLQTRKIKIRPIDGWKMGSNIIFVVLKLESSLLESNSFEIIITCQIQSTSAGTTGGMCTTGIISFMSMSQPSQFFRTIFNWFWETVALVKTHDSPVYSSTKMEPENLTLTRWMKKLE